MTPAQTSPGPRESPPLAKRPRGRPRKPIDRATFEKLCGLLCTRAEVCTVLDVDDMTLNRWCRRTYGGATFSSVYKRFSAPAKVALRQAQFKQAAKDPTMAIWLGQQYLGQRKDRP